MRLLAGTVTVTAAPPPAGVSVSAETETSKEITLSAGASPKRTCVVPAAVVVPGPGLVDVLDPPQPAASAIIAVSAKANTNLVMGLNECLKVVVCIFLYLS